jgi:LPS export ABC transporter permease LptF
MRLKILRWYLLREFIPPFIGSAAFFTMLLLLERVMSFVRLVAGGYADVFDLMVLVFFSIPPTLALTMPMATLMGALISVSRLSHDSEITAVRASGVRVPSMLLSLYFAGVVIGVASFYMTDRLVPIGNIQFRTLYQRLTLARPDIQVDDLSVNKLTQGVTLIVEEVDEEGELINVTIFERGSEGVEKTITARKGRFITNEVGGSYFTLQLSDGSIQDPGEEQDPSFDSTVFEVLEFNIPLDQREFRNIVKSPRDMRLAELDNALDELEKGSRTYNRHLMEYHKKIALPFACLLFVFLGTPFVITRGRSGRGLGLGIGVLIIFFYYIFMLSIERVGIKGVIHPGLAMWIPNILFLAAGTANLLRRGRV